MKPGKYPMPQPRDHRYRYLTYCMEQSPSGEANWFAASQEIAHILWNPKVYYRFISKELLSIFILRLRPAFCIPDMTTYLVLLARTSNTLSLLATNKVSAFSFIGCTLPPKYINIIGINQKLMCTI